MKDTLRRKRGEYLVDMVPLAASCGKRGARVARRSMAQSNIERLDSR